MDLKQTMQKIAGREMTDEGAKQFCKDQWGMVVKYLDETRGERTGYFTVCELHRDDLKERGFDGSKVSDQTMKRLAMKLGNACIEGFWIDLPIVAEALEIPKRK